MSENHAEDLQGPNPDPAVDENLDIDESETDPGASPQGPHPDPPVEDEVDEASKESFRVPIRPHRGPVQTRHRKRWPS